MKNRAYLIENTITKGYWSEFHKEFKGYLFATKYDYIPYKEIKDLVKDSDYVCNIIEIYYNEKI